MYTFLKRENIAIIKDFVKWAKLMYWVSAGLHLVSSAFYLQSGIWELFTWNIFSVVLYLYAVYLSSKKIVTLPLVIVVLEVYIYSVISSVYLGWATSYHYYLLCSFLIFTLVFRTKTRSKIISASIILFTYLLLYLFDNKYSTKYILDNEIILRLSIINLTVCVLIIAAIVYIYNMLMNSIEMQLVEKQKTLENSNKTKDRFFSLVAHDLKSPMSTLMGLSDLLQERFDSFNIEKQKKFINQINLTHKDIYRLMTNLLDWSRNEQGLIKTEFSNFNIQIAIEETINLLQTTANNKKIEIQLTIPGESYVRADIQMIKTVVRNLINNAIKFSYEGGTISITVSKSDEYIQVEIKDNGIGIPEEQIDLLFTLDKPIMSRGTRNEQGTGLGLIICKEFIQKNNGTLQVSSKLKEGSTFSFTLPHA